MLLESACVPVPSEVTMLFGGALVSAPLLAADRQLALELVVAAGTAGNVVGSWLAYWAGARGGRPLVERWGRYLLLRPHELDRAHDWFERHGQGAVFFGRLLPVVRTFISLPAGVAGMDLRRFTFYTVLGCLPWCLALAWLGAELGERWDEVERLLRPFSWAIAAATVVAVVVWVRRRLARPDA
ncbi:MAG: DedA family protein [Actinomycetota bacterium]